MDLLYLFFPNDNVMDILDRFVIEKMSKPYNIFGRINIKMYNGR